MYKAVALTSIAALAGQSLGLNVHRHEHQMNKRAITTDWCTVWETVYVTVDPSESTAAPASATGFGIKDVPNPTGGAAGNNAGAVPTVTSTSTIVVPSSTAAAASSAAPAVKESTTLSTAVRQTTAAPVQSSSTSAAPASSAPASSSKAASSTPAAPPTTSQTPTPTPTPSSSSQAPPPSSSSKAAAPSQPASPPSSVGGFPGKRGMAYNDGNLANTFGGDCEKCHWAYNWGIWPSDIDTSKYSYVPTLWAPFSPHSDGFDAQAEAALASGSKAIFSFNEPDIASQANMSPGAAAAAHAQWLNKYSGKALIGAPAVSNSGQAGQGLDWLQQFVDACSSQSGGCAFDFCNVHWYSPISAIDTLFSHIEGASKICGGKPVFLTEFAPIDGSDADKAAFLEQALPKLDASPIVMGYSYFMVSDGILMNGNSPSVYGNTYATA